MANSQGGRESGEGGERGRTGKPVLSFSDLMGLGIKKGEILWRGTGGARTHHNVLHRKENIEHSTVRGGLKEHQSGGVSRGRKIFLERSKGIRKKQRKRPQQFERTAFKKRGDEVRDIISGGRSDILQ